MNDQNLRPIISSENARDLQKKSAEARKRNTARRKAMREDLEAMLTKKIIGDDGKKGTVQQGVVTALLRRALTGDVKAIELILKITGEDKVEPVKEEQKIIIEAEARMEEWGQ